jgi:hypothetical protein
MWQPDLVWHAVVCVRVCRFVRVCAQAQGVFEDMPERPGRDVYTMSLPRHVVAAHGEAVAGSWRGTARLGHGSAS